MSRIAEKNKTLAFAVLVGGKSSRFGSDKGIYEFKGKPLISYQLELISQFNKDVFIVAKSRDQVQKYADKVDISKLMGFIIDDREFIEDDDLRTPMIGFYSTFKELKELKYQRVFILSCDMPLIRHQIVELLIDECEGYDCCIPKWDNGFIEPLFAIYPVEKGYKVAQELLKEEIYRLEHIFKDDWAINYVLVEKKIKQYDKNLLTFLNINGPIDLKKLMKFYKSKNP